MDIERQLIVKGTKTHAVRTVGLDAETARLLRDHRKTVVELGLAAGAPVTPTYFVFEREPGSGDPLPPDRVSQAWRRLRDQEGVRARLHDLRHLQGSLLLDAGEAVTTVAARLGHKDTAITLKVYGHPMPGADARAAELVGEALGARPSTS
jgi:integrase